MNTVSPPLALFDALEYIEQPEHSHSLYAHFKLDDYERALSFLKCYVGSKGTFNSYRREVERLLQWCWIIQQKSIIELKRDDIEAFMKFCLKPPVNWIGIKKSPKFILKDGIREPNPEWRPFVVTVSKAAHRNGIQPDVNKFELSQGAIKESFAILSSFYNYLIQEEYTTVNPVALIRQKSKFVRKQQSQQQIKRLTELQWLYVIKAAKVLAAADPEIHERTLFIMSALYGMYLRISELASSERWQPSMNHFHRDHDGNWWFTTVGKGNKERQIAVSDSMLESLKRWRRYLQLTALPTPADNSPLLPKYNGRGGITSTTYLRDIVQLCFDTAIEHLNADNHAEEAEMLLEATAHWLRHTGISDDVRHRPREHVRDDAGHSSSATTDRYIDVQLRERHRSAKDKVIDEEEQ